MNSAVEVARRLEQVFSTIERERMSDVPILNRELSVQAVGFCEWQDGWLGVLITPWFMNLMLLPSADETPQHGHPGEKVLHTLPSGDYEFIVGEEDGIGRYQMCSLFSPVFEFEDHAAAVATAEAVMAALLTPDAEACEATEAETESGANPIVARPLSRRDLLRGFTDAGAE